MCLFFTFYFLVPISLLSSYSSHSSSLFFTASSNTYLTAVTSLALGFLQTNCDSVKMQINFYYHVLAKVMDFGKKPGNERHFGSQIHKLSLRLTHHRIIY